MLLLLLAAPAALAQQDALGDEFIFFVDGANVLIPEVQATTVNDPLEPTSGNKVARFSASGWAHNAFTWPGDGVDATASVGATYGASDTLYFRILSDPANGTVTADGAARNVNLWITDKTNGISGTRADLEAGTVDGDLEFRAIWAIPAYVHDGEWHEFALPLPPATYAALEEAKAAADNGDGTYDPAKIDTLAARWRYAGAWTAGGTEGGFGVGPDFSTDPATDPLWQEFEWDALYKMGPAWDNADGGGPIYLDDVYIGGPSTSTASARALPTAMTGVTGEGDSEANTVSWAAIDGAGGYKVYASLLPITDITADGVAEIARIGFGEGLSYDHEYEPPFEGVGADGLYYAVTTLSQFGVENPDVSGSMVEIDNDELPVKPYVKRLDDSDVNTMFNALSENNVVDGFPDDHPVFVMDSDHRTVTEGLMGDDAPTDDDLSARIKIGYSSDNFLIVYGDVTDDVTAFAGEGIGGGDTWNYDAFEIGYGNYELTEVDGGGLLVGSPHQDITRGSDPDYQFRMAGRVDGSGAFAASSTFIGFSLDQEVEGGGTVVETTDTGWHFLTLIPLDAIQATGDNADDFLAPPADDELQFLPLLLALNDADDTGVRESQIVWSTKSNVTNQWWNTPAQWETVAFAGANAVFIGTEDGADLSGFALRQSAPNPAAGRASITFSLGTPRQATVEVFNTLGQRVAVVANGDFVAGEHTVDLDTRDFAAGVYVYRLSAGDFVATRRMTVVR